jgi:hypothetical protein
MAHVFSLTPLSAHIPPIHSRSLQRLYKENHQRTLLAGPPAPDLAAAAAATPAKTTRAGAAARAKKAEREKSESAATPSSGHRRCTSPHVVSSYPSYSFPIAAAPVQRESSDSSWSGGAGQEGRTGKERVGGDAEEQLEKIGSRFADRLAAVSEAVAAGRRLEAAAPFFFLAAARGKRPRQLPRPRRLELERRRGPRRPNGKRASRRRRRGAHIPPIHSRSLQRLYKENHQRTLLAGPPAPDLLESASPGAAAAAAATPAKTTRAGAAARAKKAEREKSGPTVGGSGTLLLFGSCERKKVSGVPKS